MNFDFLNLNGAEGMMHLDETKHATAPEAESGDGEVFEAELVEAEEAEERKASPAESARGSTSAVRAKAGDTDTITISRVDAPSSGAFEPVEVQEIVEAEDAEFGPAESQPVKWASQEEGAEAITISQVDPIPPELFGAIDPDEVLEWQEFEEPPLPVSTVDWLTSGGPAQSEGSAGSVGSEEAEPKKDEEVPWSSDLPLAEGIAPKTAEDEVHWSSDLPQVEGALAGLTENDDAVRLTPVVKTVTEREEPSPVEFTRFVEVTPDDDLAAVEARVDAGSPKEALLFDEPVSYDASEPPVLRTVEPPALRTVAVEDLKLEKSEVAIEEPQLSDATAFDDDRTPHLPVTFETPVPSAARAVSTEPPLAKPTPFDEPTPYIPVTFEKPKPSTHAAAFTLPGLRNAALLYKEQSQAPLTAAELMPSQEVRAAAKALALPSFPEVFGDSASSPANERPAVAPMREAPVILEDTASRKATVLQEAPAPRVASPTADAPVMREDGAPVHEAPVILEDAASRRATVLLESPAPKTPVIVQGASGRDTVLLESPAPRTAAPVQDASAVVQETNSHPKSAVRETQVPHTTRIPVQEMMSRRETTVIEAPRSRENPESSAETPVDRKSPVSLTAAAPKQTVRRESLRPRKAPATFEDAVSLKAPVQVGDLVVPKKVPSVYEELAVAHGPFATPERDATIRDEVSFADAQAPIRKAEVVSLKDAEISGREERFALLETDAPPVKEVGGIAEAPSDPASQIDPLWQRVVRALNTGAFDGSSQRMPADGTLVATEDAAEADPIPDLLRLDDGRLEFTIEEDGAAIRVRVLERDGFVSVEARSTSPQLADALARSEADLRRVLEASGFSLSDFDSAKERESNAFESPEQRRAAANDSNSTGPLPKKPVAPPRVIKKIIA